jgi:transposase
VHVRVTSLFNRLLALPGTSVVGVRFVADGVEVDIRLRSGRLRCPCGFSTRAGYDRSRRRWRHIDLAAAKLWLVAVIRRLDCPNCGVRTEDVPWARPGARHTRDFEDTVTWLAQRTDKTTISRLLRCSWEAVANIVTRVVANHLDDRRLDRLYRIGVDEVCYRHPGQYLSVVGDHDRRRVVWVAPGRDKAALASFYDALGPEGRAGLQAVSMDMSAAYTNATAQAVPHAVICCDPFHVIQWANRALDAVYSAETAGRARLELAPRQRRQLRWNLRTGAERLTPDRARAVNQLRRSANRLYRAWQLKEQLRDLYRNVAPEHAYRYLTAWCTAARRSRIPAFTNLAATIDVRRAEITAALQHGLSNGLIEGINSKIRLINARGYGHHSPQALTAMIYLCLGGINIQLPTQR